MRRSLPVTLAVAVTVLLTVLVGSAQAADPHGGRRGTFRVGCDFSHRSSDDPIVMPGMAGMAHSHDFFGSTTTRASSTYTSMVAGDTTCDRPGDTAGYWTPTIYDHGRAVESKRTTVYYRNYAPDQSSIHTIPANFRMIAGDSHATTAPQPQVVGWSCRHASGHKGAWAQAVPTCPSGEFLVFRARFPDCWNGTAIDSADHRSHVAYRLHTGECPKGFAVTIPQISVEVLVGGTQGGPGVTLSSGKVATGHADFWNTWRQAELDRLVRVCLAAGRQCATGG